MNEKRNQSRKDGDDLCFGACAALRCAARVRRPVIFTAGTQGEQILKGFCPEIKLANLLLSLMIRFSAGEQ